MKLRIILLLHFLILSLFNLQSQCGLDAGVIEISSQFEVNQFANEFGNCDSLFHTTIVFNESQTTLDPIISLASFHQVKWIKGGFRLFDLYHLENLEGLENIEYIGEELSLINIPKLETIDYFDNLDTVGLLKIWELPLIKSIDTFNELKQASFIEIRRMDSLNSLNIFEDLEYCDAFLISQCWEIESIPKLEFEVKHVIQISNSGLISLDCFNEIEFFPEGTVEITNNPNLVEINSFENLKNVENLRLALNFELDSDKVNGFQNLDTIYGQLRIQKNRQIDHLNFLSSVRYIGENVLISDNDKLTTLDPLFGAGYEIHDELKVWENPNLVDCDALCYHISVGRPIEVYENSEQCTDLATLIEHCGSVGTNDIHETVSLYPNPVINDVISIDQEKDLEYSLYDQVGKLVAQGKTKNQSISLTNIQSGQYFMELFLKDRKRSLQKIIKL